MKRFVREDAGIVAAITIATAIVVAATGAGAGATYLIVVGFLAVAILWDRFHEAPPSP